jgi:hypothetical protein
LLKDRRYRRHAKMPIFGPFQPNHQLDFSLPAHARHHANCAQFLLPARRVRVFLRTHCSVRSTIAESGRFCIHFAVSMNACVSPSTARTVPPSISPDPVEHDCDRCQCLCSETALVQPIPSHGPHQASNALDHGSAPATKALIAFFGNVISLLHRRDPCLYQRRPTDVG